MPDPTSDRPDPDRPQPTKDEDDAGKVNIPMAIVAGTAAFVGGLAGAIVGSGLG